MGSSPTLGTINGLPWTSIHDAERLDFGATYSAVHEHPDVETVDAINGTEDRGWKARIIEELG